MKVAAQSIPVYSDDANKLIGRLECGDAVHTLCENSKGTLIAYIFGLIKKQDGVYLADMEEWEKTAGDIERFLAYAASRVGCLYVSGGQGQTMTAELIRRLEKDDSNYKRALKAYQKHLKSGGSLTGYDCSGLIIAHLLGSK